MSVRYSGAVRFGELVRVHARTARRQRSLWYATVPLTLLAVLLSVDAPAAPGTGGIDDLVFVARVMGTLIGIAYAAAFTGLLVAPARLGVDELELSTSVGTTTLGAARVLGTFAVVMVPPLVVLVGVGLVQTVGGSWTGLPAALLVAVAMEVPTVLCALAVSALAGSVLPQALARVVAVLTWLYLTMTTPTIPVPGVTGTVLGVVGEGFASLVSPRFFWVNGPLATAPGPVVAAVSLLWQLALVLTCLVVGSRLAGRSRR